MQGLSVSSFAFLCVISLVACTPQPSAPATNTGGADDAVPEVPEDAVAFRIHGIGAPNKDTLKIAAQWTGDGQNTQFDIVMRTPSPKPDQPFTFSKGWLIARHPSQAKAFISSIAAVHGVPDSYTVPAHVDSLGFTVAILGQDLSRGVTRNDIVAGGFKHDPPGPWLTTKLFFGDGDIELYLNIDQKDGVAEFSVKDPANGTALLPVLASVVEAP